VSDADEECLECGLRSAAGAPNCAELRDLLFARDFEQPALYAKHHRLAIDCYCVQHSPYVLSAKSLAAHLCGLCVALERGNDRELIDGIQRWLSSNPAIEKPQLPAKRGELTIADVSEIADPDSYGVAVNAWARSSWSAYEDLQPIARQWLELSLKHRR
jgi:hypothetical protein